MNNVTKGVMHGVVSLGLFAIPLILMSGHTYTDLTIGGILTAAYHWLLAYNATQQ